MERFWLKLVLVHQDLRLLKTKSPLKTEGNHVLRHVLLSSLGYWSLNEDDARVPGKKKRGSGGGAETSSQQI